MAQAVVTRAEVAWVAEWAAEKGVAVRAAVREAAVVEEMVVAWAVVEERASVDSRP